MLSWILSALILLGVLAPITTTTQAVVPEVVSAETFVAPDAAWPGNDELYEAYLEKLFYPADSVSYMGDMARNQLSSKGQKLYDFLKANLIAVASGTSSSTAFTLSAEQIAAWGGTINYEKRDSQTSQDAATAALAAFMAEFELEKVIAALLHDCPYEMYWYDKVTGVNTSGRFSLSGNNCNIVSVEQKFAVVADMQAENYSSEAPAFDTSAVAAATEAACYAQDIVDRFAKKTDYEKLLAYQKEICALVSYDKAAVSGGNFSVDADPWQLIYVFDGNPLTNVVCEGYVKAFQYLFDLSDFDGNISCISVSGILSGDRHMWNIVTVNDQNYLTDITSSDTDIAGADDGLFLEGATGSITSGYHVKGLPYTYDNRTLALWGSGEDSRLKIAAQKCTPCEFSHVEVIDVGVEATCTEAGLTEGIHCAACGFVLTAQQVLPPIGHDYMERIVAPTCTEAGYTEHICRTCSDQYVDQKVAALGHSWLAATCKSSKTCKVCGIKDGLPLDHIYEDNWDTSCDTCGYIRELDVVLSPMYRLYNPYTHEHLLTSNEAEKDQLISIGWLFDGIAWKAPSKGKPVYRLYNPFDDWHTYTMSQEEIDMLVPLGWKVDGVICYSATEAGAKQIYRLFNPYEQKNYHLLTASTEERDLLEKAGWIVEGVAWQAAK